MYTSTATAQDDDSHRQDALCWHSDPDSWFAKWCRLRFHQKLSVIGICIVFAVWFWGKLDKIFR